MSDLDTQVDTAIETSVATEAPAVQATDTPVVETLSHDERIASDIEKAWSAHERARDEASGRFIAKESGKTTEQAPKTAATPAAQTAQPTPQTQTETPATQPAGAAMPASWSKADAALWAALPPEAQAKLNQREEQIARGFARYEGVAEFADMAERSGTTLRDALTSYRQYEVGMQQRPIETLINLAKLYRVNPADLSAALQGGAELQQVQQMPRPQPVDIGAEVDRRLQAHDINRQVTDFMKDPANKHFDTVSDHLAALLRADRSLSLKDAYDQACWAHPQVRALLQKEEAARLQAEQAKTARATTQTAERASRGLVATPGATLKPAPRRMSIDDAIEAAFEQHA